MWIKKSNSLLKLESGSRVPSCGTTAGPTYSEYSSRVSIWTLAVTSPARQNTAGEGSKSNKGESPKKYFSDPIFLGVLQHGWSVHCN